MSWSNPLFIISVAIGVIFFLAALFTKLWPAKNINDLYGYRTRRSKRSQEAWDFAQNYSNRQMFLITIPNLLLGCTGLLIQLNDLFAILLSLIVMVVTILWLFWKTEGKLKERFGE